MIDAAIKALSQMFRPPCAHVLLKAVGLALILITIIGILMQRLLAAWAETGANWAEQTTGVAPHAVWSALAWVLSIMAGLGIITGALFLMPVVTAFVGSFFVDEIAEAVEREHYPAEPARPSLAVFPCVARRPGVRCAGVTGLSLRAAVRAIRRARRDHSVSGEFLSCSAANISNWPPCASAHRTKPRPCARPTRFTSSLPVCSLRSFVSIPVVNLATPIFAMAFMVHIHKKLFGIVGSN